VPPSLRSRTGVTGPAFLTGWASDASFERPQERLALLARNDHLTE